MVAERHTNGIEKVQMREDMPSVLEHLVVDFSPLRSGGFFMSGALVRHIPDEKVVFVNGRKTKLPTRPNSLLRVLGENLNATVPSERLRSEALLEGSSNDDLHSEVLRLRRSIGDDHGGWHLIQHETDIGYRLGNWETQTGTSLSLLGNKVRYFPDVRAVAKSGKMIRLDPQADTALRVLYENAGKKVRRVDLESKLWPEGIFYSARLSQTIFSLRHALEPDPKNPRLVLTVRGKNGEGGYMLATKTLHSNVK